MNIEPKAFIELAGWLVSLGISVGGTIVWVKFKLKSHDKRLVDIEVIGSMALLLKGKVDTHEERLDAVEGLFVTENKEPRLLTFRAHNHICKSATESILSEFKHVTDAVDRNTLQVKDMSEQVNNMAVTVAVLEGKVNEG